MKTKLIAVISIVLLMGLTSLVFADAEIKTIKVVIDDNYPPFSFRNEEGELIGISIDQWELFELKTGIDVTVVGMDWATSQRKMNNGEFDVIDTIFKSEIRESIYDFTEPYAEIATSIYFQNNISGIVDIESAKGFSIASKSGGLSTEILLNMGVENIVLYESYEDIIKAANNSEIVMFIMDQPPAKYFLFKSGIQNHFNFTDPVYSSYFYRAVKEGNTELVSVLNNGFQLFTDKEIEEINEKWYGKSNASYSEYIKYISIIIISLIILLVLFFFVNLYLRKKVNQKTHELMGLLDENRSLTHYLKAVLNAIPDMIFVLDKKGHFLDIDIDEKEEILIKRNESIGKSILELFPGQLGIDFNASLEKFLQSNIIEPYEYKIEKDGKFLYYQLRYSNIDDNRVLAIVHDITEQQIIKEKISEHANIDLLTGIYNRNYFEKYISDLDVHNENYGILICGIDSMKFINDTLGHFEGDQHLKLVANLLKNNLPESALIARIGGDEFGCILDDINVDKLEAIKIKIKNDLNQYAEMNSFIETSISIGYSVKKGTDNVREVFKTADKEMYTEKLSHKYQFKTGNISLLIKMLEERNFETGEHAQRLDQYCVSIARRLNKKENFINKISLFAKFHDIGKIGISDTILLKPGKLTNDEYEEIKKLRNIQKSAIESLNQ